MDSILHKCNPMQMELSYMFMQYLREEKHLTVLHKLEENCAIYFNQESLGNLIAEGSWDDAATYISAFTTLEDGMNSNEILFLLKKQKYLETLYMGELTDAGSVLENELSVFESMQHQMMCAKFRKLQKTRNFRTHDMFSGFEDLASIRARIFQEIKNLIADNPNLRGKMEFPEMEESRLKKVIHQSVLWQHKRCKNPSNSWKLQSLFVDHTCDDQNAAEAALEVSPHSDSSWQIDVSHTIHVGDPSVSAELPISNAPVLPRENGNSHPGRALKRRLQTEVDNNQQSLNLQESFVLKEELPLSVVTSFTPDSKVTSMEFHPVHQGTLAIGTDAGDLSLWDVNTNKNLLNQTYKYWKGAYTSATKVPTVGAPSSKQSSSVKVLKWNSDGSYLAVGYSENIVRIFGYFSKTKLDGYQEIKAHEGSVNDVAFITTLGENLMTCGNDMTIKVWNIFSGVRILCFRGHESPVISICHRNQNSLETMVSSDSNGEVKIWCFDTERKNIISEGTLLTTPHRVAAKVAFSTDGTRLFLGGTNCSNDSYIAEINQDNGSIVHVYSGLVAPCVGFLNYHIANGKYLAAVDENLLKFWDVNTEEIQEITPAGGDLAASSCIQFSKDGTLLAIMTNSNSVKILANTAGKRRLRAMGKRAMEPTSAAPYNAEEPSKRKKSLIPISMDNIEDFSEPDEENRMPEDVISLLESSTFKEISEVSQCQCRRLPNKFSKISVCWLAYLNSGRALLALGSNGEHRQWLWDKDSQNANGMATTHCVPKIWNSPNDVVMKNDVGFKNQEENISCFALPAQPRSFIVSTSGGKVYIYNISNYKNIAKIFSPPPAATSLAIHPKDCNKIIMGMDNGSIQIYDNRARQVVSTLSGHTDRVTGLTFSDFLNALVSSGADSQVCMWNMKTWEKLESSFLYGTPGSASDTHVEFHKDQIKFLVADHAQIFVYTATDFTVDNRWVPEDGSSSFITHAVYSCDCLSIFAGFGDGSVGVITASSFDLRCKINPTTYLPRNIRTKPFPLVVAAHPSEPNQFAIGLSDGQVVVLEPLEEDVIWGNLPEYDDDEDENDDDSGEGTPRRPIDLDELQWVDSD